jgi:copper/silver efflux system protein
MVAGAIGGENIGETVEGLARFPINLRYPRECATRRTSCAALPILTPNGQQITLGTVATVRVSDGPPMLKSENARPVGLGLRRRARARPASTVAADLQAAVAAGVKLSPA